MCRIMHAYAFQNPNGLTRDDVDDPQLKSWIKERKSKNEENSGAFTTDNGTAFPISLLFHCCYAYFVSNIRLST